MSCDDLEHALFSEGSGHANISGLEKTLLNEIKNRICPITYTDIVIGNFIVNLDDNKTILYKVIETNGASFEVVTNNGSASVFYATDNKSMLLCRSVTLRKDFHYKISGLDIKRIIERRQQTPIDTGRQPITKEEVVTAPTAPTAPAVAAITVFRQAEPVNRNWFLTIASCGFLN